MSDKPDCFMGDKNTCLGYSNWNDDEPTDTCKLCDWQESHESDNDESK
jgi:hypothetical protein